MKHLAIASLILPLSGCAALGQFGITPSSGPVIAAIAVETRTGANCIRSAERGENVSALHRFRVGQARLAFDATVAPTLSENSRGVLGESRALTDAQCPALTTEPPLPEPMP